MCPVLLSTVMADVAPLDTLAFQSSMIHLTQR
jgi:hypothetical protein